MERITPKNYRAPDNFGFEIRGHHRSEETNAGAAYVSSVAEAKEFADPGMCGYCNP